MYPYSNSIQPKTCVFIQISTVPYCHTFLYPIIVPYTHSLHINSLSSIPVIFSFLFLFFLLFFSLLLLLLLLLPFSSLLSYPCLLSLSPRPKMRYLFWSYPFYFTFQSKEETSSLFPLSHLSLPQFSSLFYSNIFLLLLFGPPIFYYS